MQTITGNNYYLNLKDSYGNLIAVITNFLSLEYNRSVNNVGRLELQLPIEYFQLIQSYYLLEVWRSAGGGVTSMYLDMETLWIIIDYEIKLTESNELYVSVVAEDGNRVLAKRYVAYYASRSQTSKTGLCGDVMKAVIRENVASTASDYNSSTTRGLPASIFTVQNDLGDGASVSMSFSWRRVLDVLKDLADASDTAGTYIAFDMVSDGFGHLEFRTYQGQRGVDHRLSTNNPIIVDPYIGNLAETSLAFDYSNEVTFVYAAGQGTDAARAVATSSNSTRLAVSPFARCEVFQDARQATTLAQVQDIADAALRAGKGQVSFNSKIIETVNSRYGIEYGLGSILPCQFMDQLVNCRLDKVHVTVSGGKEIIDVGLQSLV